MPTDHAVARDKRYLDPQERLYIVGLDWQLQWYPSEIDIINKRIAEHEQQQTLFEGV